MSLSELQPVGFLATRDAAVARAFFESTLQLRFVADDGFALVFGLGTKPGTTLRIVRVGSFEPLPFTVFGWETPDIERSVGELAARGVRFERYSSLEQDVQGIWSAPNGARIAWFYDPDRNLLSLTQHAS